VILRWRLLAASMCLLETFAVVGCNRGGNGSQPPAATIAGSSGTAPSTEGIKVPSSQPSTGDPKHPVVLIETSQGNITVQLDAEKAFGTVENFLAYVSAKFYDQTIVHLVYKGQGIVAGGYGANLVEKPARTPIRNEAQNGLKNRRGAVAMVRQADAIDSAASQFFINVADNPELDYKDRTPAGYGYCVFGQVLEGMEVVDRINAVPIHSQAGLDQTPAQPIVVKSIRRIR